MGAVVTGAHGGGVVVVQAVGVGGGGVQHGGQVAFVGDLGAVSAGGHAGLGQHLHGGLGQFGLLHGHGDLDVDLFHGLHMFTHAGDEVGRTLGKFVEHVIGVLEAGQVVALFVTHDGGEQHTEQDQERDQQDGTPDKGAFFMNKHN